MKKAFVLLGLLAGSLTASAQWVTQPVTFPNAPALPVVISGVDANVAWTTVIDDNNGPSQYLLRTTNGGTTWSVVNVAGLSFNEGITYVQAIDANTAWITVSALSSGGGGRVMKTTDGGTIWTASTSASQFGPGSFPESVHFFSSTQGVALGDPVGGKFELYTTSNGGTTWTAVPTANIPTALSGENIGLASGGLSALAYVGNTLWCYTDGGRVLRTTDAGQTWTIANTPFMGGTKFPEAIAFRDASNGLVLTDDGDLARTTDGGTTWTAVAATGPLHSIGLDAIPGTRTYISTGFGAAPGGAGSSYSTNDGASWTAIESTTQHLLVDFVSPTVGWSGAVIVDSRGNPLTGSGLNKYTGPALATTRQKDLALQVAPNPSADGRFRVQVPAGATAQLRVRDALGRLVLEQPAPAAAETTLDLSRCRAGVYTLELRAGDALGQQKLVVQ